MKRDLVYKSRVSPSNSPIVFTQNLRRSLLLVLLVQRSQVFRLWYPRGRHCGAGGGEHLPSWLLGLQQLRLGLKCGWKCPCLEVENIRIIRKYLYKTYKSQAFLKPAQWMYVCKVIICWSKTRLEFSMWIILKVWQINVHQHQLMVASSTLPLVGARSFQEVCVFHPGLPTPNPRNWIPGQIGNDNAMGMPQGKPWKQTFSILQEVQLQICEPYYTNPQNCPRQAEAHWCICQDWRGLSLLRMSQMRPRGLMKFWPAVSKMEMGQIQDTFLQGDL